MTQSIGEVADALGVSVDTLRYYEKAGLADPPPRDAGGRRRYAPEQVAWLQFLIRMRATGMPIHTLQTYTAALRVGPSSARERREILERHREDVVAQIARLTDCLGVLDYKIANYAAVEAKLAAATPTHPEEVPA